MRLDLCQVTVREWTRMRRFYVTPLFLADMGEISPCKGAMWGWLGNFFLAAIMIVQIQVAVSSVDSRTCTAGNAIPAKLGPRE